MIIARAPRYSRTLRVRHAGDDELPAVRAVGERAFGHTFPSSFYPAGTTLVGEDSAGRMVCSLVYRPAPGFWGRARVPMAAPGGVGTHPDHRQRGYAGALMVHTLRILRERGIAASPLYPFSFPYYAKFGWAVGALATTIASRPSLLAQLGRPDGVRRARSSDLPAIKRAYSRFARAHNACTDRPAAWWSDGRHTWLPHASDPTARWLVHEDRRGRVDGYAHLHTRPRHDEEGVSVDVKELVGPPEAERALAAALGKVRDASRIDILLPMDSALPAYLPCRTGMQLQQRFAFRVVDPTRALTSLKPERDLPGPVRYRVWDWTLSRERPVEVCVRAAEGRVVESRSRRAPKLTCTVNTFSQLFSGFLSAQKAVAMGLAEVSAGRAAELSDALLFGRVPFRSYNEPG